MSPLADGACSRRYHVSVAAHMTHRSGAMEPVATASALDALLAELDGPDDPEHPNVAVTHESGWTLGAFPDGRLIWEDEESEQPNERHKARVSRNEMRPLLALLAAGDIAAVEAAGWEPGYGR